jgi:hypothetical protein
MEALTSLETSQTTHPTTQHHIATHEPSIVTILSQDRLLIQTPASAIRLVPPDSSSLTSAIRICVCLQHELSTQIDDVMTHDGICGMGLPPGLWSRYTKLPTPTPQFLKLRPLHRSSVRINNGKPVRHFITTT